MFNSIIESTLTIQNVLICICVSLILGILIALIHMKTTKYNKNFIVTLALLPVLVQVVIMMVNGNLGTSVAVLGAFSLIRFRSIPGNSREITSIFFAMAIGLAVGMGQIYFAILLSAVISCLIIILYKTKFGEIKENSRFLKIIIPEDLDYEEVFDEILKKYTKEYKLIEVKTTNMGSMFELKYEINLKNNLSREFINDLRIRNGNMKIVLTHPVNDSLL